VTIQSGASFRVPQVYGMSSSASGTVYLSDRKGGRRSRLFFRPAPLSSGAVAEDLGLDVTDLLSDKIPLIVGDTITVPQPGAHVGNVASVDWCRAGACSPAQRASIPLTVTEAYLTNAGTGILVYDTDGTRSLRIKGFDGSVNAVGTLPSELTVSDYFSQARADSNGAVLVAGWFVYYLDFAAKTVTQLSVPYGAVAISSAYLANLSFYYDKISVYQRNSLGAPPVVFPTPKYLKGLEITDTAIAWLVQESWPEHKLRSGRVASGISASYPRNLTNLSLSRYENTDDFLIYDATAATPGFYRLAGGATAGTLAGVLGPRDATTQSLELSHDRVLYSDDSSPTIPLFLRDVSALPTLGAQLAVTTATTTPLPPTVDLAARDLNPAGVGGRFVVFARPNGTDPAQTDIVFGQPGGVLDAVTLPPTDKPYAIQVSGHRALILGGNDRTKNSLLDMLTGGLSPVPNMYASLWGDYLLTLGIQDAALRRTDLVTGAVATLLPANPTGSSIEDLYVNLPMWGDQLAYRFHHAGVLVSGVWTATSATTGTTTPYPDVATAQISELSDGLLVTHDVTGRTTAYDLRTGVTAVVADQTTLVGPAVDGYRVGWVRGVDGRGVVADVRTHLPGYALSAPLLVTAAAPAGYALDAAGTARWQPHFYSSRGVTWTLRLRTGGATGAVVRVFSGVSSFGEITLSGGWDGTDGFGADLRQATYTWTLTGSADGRPLSSPKGSTALTGQVYLSRTPPAAPTVTTPAFSTDISATASFDISWASTGAPAGTTYTIRSSLDGGPFTTLDANVPSTSMTVTGAPAQTLRFEVTATDPAGRTSAPGTAQTVIPYDDASPGVGYTGTWIVVSAADRYDGDAHTSGVTDSTVTFSATGTAITIVGDRGPTTGEFQIAYDGGPWSPPIDTHAPAPRVRQVLDTHTFTGAASAHTVKLRVVGTSGRPDVAVDAIAYTN
jgi:hypothetical protein